MSCTRLLLTGLCVCGFAAASAAATVTLNVRPGLWQMSSSGETHGAPPIPTEMLARLPPAQQARIKAAMAASMQHAAKAHVYKYCVTEKSLRRGFNPVEDSAGNCKAAIVKSSGSTLDVREECSGRHEHGSGHVHFEALNAQTVNGTVDMTMSDGTHTMRVKRVMHGQWLAADCGKYAHNDQ